jgi:cytochrome P450
MPTFPVSSLDPFADDFLAAPYPFYAELREAGPVARTLWAVGVRVPCRSAGDAERLADVQPRV